ncbi:MAG: SLBB domain-containing protein [Acidimicrobiia bacterium]|nr:SLBB domain-containing protein [Acidimicrobiia bacterium]
MTHIGGSPRLLTALDTLVGVDLDAWLAGPGGAALTAAVADPAAAREAVRLADLRGMGGAAFPTARKWDAVAAATVPAGERWVIANGNEDEPGTFKDRVLLEHAPHLIIEGALAAAACCGAANVVLYVNPRHAGVEAAIAEAVAQWRDHHLLDELERVLGEPVRLRVHASSGLYVGGEDTAAIASVEGGFPFPRRKPPYPTTHGVEGMPTVVNNVETLAQAAVLLRLGAPAYRDLGVGEASGTRLYSLSGDVIRPGLYELPSGTSLRSLVFDHGGGMLADRSFKAVFTGGPSNTLLATDGLDVALDPDSVVAAGSRLGTGAMIVISEGTSITRKVAEYIDFFAGASCGPCPPCRTGTHQLSQILHRIDTGHGTPADLDTLRSLTALLPGSGNCGLVDAAATVVASALERFPHEFERQVHHR